MNILDTAHHLLVDFGFWGLVKAFEEVPMYKIFLSSLFSLLFFSHPALAITPFWKCTLNYDKFYKTDRSHYFDITEYAPAPDPENIKAIRFSNLTKKLCQVDEVLKQIDVHPDTLNQFAWMVLTTAPKTKETTRKFFEPYEYGAKMQEMKQDNEIAIVTLCQLTCALQNVSAYERFLEKIW